jgi:hypothetical protein
MARLEGEIAKELDDTTSDRARSSSARAPTNTALRNISKTGG